MVEKNTQQKDNEYAVILQKRLRGILDRKKVEAMRQEELIFLGMARPKTRDQSRGTSIAQMKNRQRNRKLVQEENAKQFENDKEEIKDLIKDNEGPDIIANMSEDRRKWIQEYKANHAGKVPDDLTDFYKRFEV